MANTNALLQCLASLNQLAFDGLHLRVVEWVPGNEKSADYADDDGDAGH